MVLISFDAANVPVVDIIAAEPEFMMFYTDGGHAADRGTVLVTRAAGIGTGANHENSITELGGGYAAGVGAANKTIPVLLDWGMPQYQGFAAFYSADTEIPISEFGPYLEAFRGINDVHAGRWAVGVYGEGALIDALAEAGLIQVKGWLSSSYSFPGYNPNSPNVGLVQSGEKSPIDGTDQDTITDITALGIWWAPGQKYVNTPPFKAKEEDMGNRPTMYRQRQAGEDQFGAVFVDIGGGLVKSIAANDYGPLQDTVNGPGWEDREIDAGLWNVVRNYLTVVEPGQDPAAVANAVVAALKASQPQLDVDALKADISAAVHAGMTGLSVITTIQ